MGSSSNGVAPNNVDKGVDYANYFCTYAFLYHQKEMLSDRVRMDAYYNAIFQNKHHFVGKAVLDVGTGSGILALWSAQAGARKVYAVEATKMAEHARELVKTNGFEHVVEVIEGSMEDITLPEKVDVIISEWMGYFLLRESMFDSVICARDRWLKPDGVMYPSHARMWIAPIRSGLVDQKKIDYDRAMDDWSHFVNETKTFYGVDMGSLTKPFMDEQRKYYLQTSLWNNLHPNQVIGKPAVIKEIDCLTSSVNDLLSLHENSSSIITAENTRFCGFGGWFDVHFRGRKENPAKHEIELTTAPNEDLGTHWGQQNEGGWRKAQRNNSWIDNFQVELFRFHRTTGYYLEEKGKVKKMRRDDKEIKRRETFYSPLTVEKQHHLKCHVKIFSHQRLRKTKRRFQNIMTYGGFKKESAT